MASDHPEAPSRRRSARPWWLLPLGVFLLTRLVDAAILMWVARGQLSAAEIGPAGVVPTVRDPATYWNVIQSWDGQWFRLIAEHGYPSSLPTVDGAVQQNPWAFYPLFPFLTRGVMTVTALPFGVAAGLLNLVLSSTGMCLLYRMVSRRADSFAGILTVLALATFPSGVVLQVAYSEALTFLLLVTSLWCLERRWYGRLLVAGLLLSVTRPVVLPLALVAGLHWLMRWRARRDDPFPVGERLRLGAVGLALVASFGIWPLTAGLVTDDPRAFLTSMDAWKVGDEVTETGWISWVTRALDSPGLLVIVLMALAAQAYFLLRRQARLWPAELRFWSFSYGAYLLVSTRPLSSFPRHLIMALVPWWPFPEAGQHVGTTRQRVSLACLVALGGFVSQYFWVHLLFVITPASVGFP